MKEPRHIVRMDQPRNRCWKLAIQRQKEQTVEYFFDGTHGGKRGALKAALRRRKEILATAPPPTPTKGIKTRRNKTGVVGVRLADEVDRRKATAYRYLHYVAEWLDPSGRKRTIGFSHNKYGEKAAFALACIARENESQNRAKVEKLGGWVAKT